METKRKDQIKFIEVANDLNQEMYEKHGEQENQFFYSTNGYIDLFGFGDIVLWNSEDDERKFIEGKDRYEDFKPFIIKKFNSFIENLHKIKL